MTTHRDLTDKYCSKWSECVEINGDPLSTQVEISQEKGNKKITFEQISKTRGGGGAGLQSFDDPKILELLSSKNFKAENFIRETKFSQEGSSHMLTHIKNSGDLTDDFSKSPIQKIADNLHYYIDATENLQETGFQGEAELRDLAVDIHKIVTNMSEFFDGILEQNKKAYEASKELNRIGSNAFLFTLALDIEKLRSMGQFDEIIRVYEKKQKLPYLEKQFPFNLALQNVEKALRGVEDSLRKKILQMTPKTFNEKYCSLLMGIQPNKNPIIEIVNVIHGNIQSDFAPSKTLVESCTTFENTFPFFKTLYDFLRDKYPDKFKSSRFIIESRIKALIDFIRETNINDLTAKSRDGKATEFNDTIHHDVQRITQMWTSVLKAKFMESSISEAREQIQTWYANFLKNNLTNILKNPNAGSSIINHLLNLLEGGPLFTGERYTKLITEPIYSLLDKIHYNLIIKGEGDLVSTIRMLITLKDKNLKDLFEKYEKCVKKPFDAEEMKQMTLVTCELTDLLKQKLICQLSVDINNKIYHSVFMNCIDWNARDLPITVDGWLVYAFNKIIDCKCTWGDMYKLMREDLIAILVSSVLYCINELPALSNRAKMRWALNLTILEETLYMNKLKPIIDPNDPAQQRTIDPQFGALGKKPELCYVAIEQALELTSNELKSIKTMTEYNLAKKQLDMQILSLK